MAKLKINVDGRKREKNGKADFFLAEEIIRLRLSQMIVNEGFKAGRFKVPVHLAFGHEALAVAVSMAMRRDDKLVLTHRNIAYNMARVKPKPREKAALVLKRFLHEYLLRPSGLQGGRFGSMNLFTPDFGIPYTSSILGNQFPVGCGFALGDQLLRKECVVFISGGDGGIEEGAFWESALMARSMRLPVIFLIENNEWSMHTKIDERRTPINLEKFSESLGLTFLSLKGNDPYEYQKRLSALREKVSRSRIAACVETTVRTLGDWYSAPNAEYPEGKFVKYHTGASPSTVLSEWPIMKEDKDDPLFVLKDFFGERRLKQVAKRQFYALKKVML